MHPLKRLFLLPKLSPSSSLASQIKRIPFSTKTNKHSPSSSTTKTAAATGDNEWNDAWESAWLPDDPSSSDSSSSSSSRVPWESSDITLPSAADAATAASSEIDADTRAFVAEMDERWNERRAAKKSSSSSTTSSPLDQKSKKKDVDEYRVRKQRIHAGLWMKEIEKMEESRVGGDPTASAAGDDIDRLLDSASEIFDSGNIDLSDSKIPSTSEFKSKPDGWETTTKNQDGNIWEISQREEDILLQEFERRIAFSKFQIASFIKSHIFSRRRPIDGWKYMIEELGPNAKRGKGSVQRLPSLTDPSTQPFREERPAIAPNLSSNRGR